MIRPLPWLCRMKRDTMRKTISLGNLSFQDPLLLCGVLSILLYFDASGFLRIGLLAAFLHETGHILVYLTLRHHFPRIDVTMTGFCMRPLGEHFSWKEQLLLAAAGPGMNGVLAVGSALCLSRQGTIRMSAFFAANLLTGLFNLLPVSPLDGAQILRCFTQWKTSSR